MKEIRQKNSSYCTSKLHPNMVKLKIVAITEQETPLLTESVLSIANCVSVDESINRSSCLFY
jgi:hypothetical protein